MTATLAHQEYELEVHRAYLRAMRAVVRREATPAVDVRGELERELVEVDRAIAALPNLALRGIMGIPAPTADRAQSRAQFRALAACFHDLKDAGFAVDTLSMGMSADLEAAIAEGATQVRVGTALFGART